MKIKIILTVLLLIIIAIVIIIIMYVIVDMQMFEAMLGIVEALSSLV